MSERDIKFPAPSSQAVQAPNLNHTQSHHTHPKSLHHAFQDVYFRCRFQVLWGQRSISFDWLYTRGPHRKGLLKSIIWRARMERRCEACPQSEPELQPLISILSRLRITSHGAGILSPGHLIKAGPRTWGGHCAVQLRSPYRTGGPTPQLGRYPFADHHLTEGHTRATYNQ